MYYDKNRFPVVEFFDTFSVLTYTLNLGLCYFFILFILSTLSTTVVKHVNS